MLTGHVRTTWHLDIMTHYVYNIHRNNGSTNRSMHVYRMLQTRLAEACTAMVVMAENLHLELPQV